MNDPVQIESRDYWFKVVDMLQQNWALVERGQQGVRIYFLSDTGGVFDEIQFQSPEAAVEALKLNGFRRFADDPQAASFLRCPEPPFRSSPHPNGPIYSSGRFWRSVPEHP